MNKTTKLLDEHNTEYELADAEAREHIGFEEGVDIINYDDKTYDLSYMRQLADMTKAIANDTNNLQADQEADEREITSLKESVDELDASKADKTSLAKTQDELDRLWKLSQGQVYDIVEQTENGMNVAPAGAKYVTLEEVHGKSEQFSTDGYQLFDANAYHTYPQYVDISPKDGWIIVNNTTSSNRYPGWELTLEPGSYSITVEVADNTSNQTIYLQTSATDYSTGVRTTQSKIITVSESGYFGILVASKNSNIIKFRIMLEKGSTAHPYEPFTAGPSPNPDYPQEIKSVERVDVKVKKGNEIISTHTITPPRPLNAIGDYKDVMDVENGVWVWNTETESIKLQKVTYNTPYGYRFVGYPTTQNFVGNIGNIVAWCDRGLFDKYAGSSISSNDGIRYSTGVGAKGTIVYQYESEASDIITEIVYPVSTHTEPINTTDLDYLQSLENLDAGNHLVITDQDGNDVSWLCEYIVKLSER